MKTRRSLLILGGLTFILAILIFGSNFWFQSSYYDQFQRFRIQSFTNHVLDRYNEIEPSIREIPDVELSNRIEATLAKRDIDLPTKTEFVFYYRGVLQDWSSNSFIFPDSIKSLSSSNGFYNLKNAYVIGKAIKVGEGELVLFRPLGSNYTINNRFLNSTLIDVFANTVSIDTSVVKHASIPILGLEGKQAYSIKIDKSQGVGELFSWVLFISWLLFFPVFITFIFTFLLQRKLLGSSLSFALFAIGILFLRFLQFKLGVPGILYQTIFFQPSIYASSFSLPSLADLLVNLILLLWLASLFSNRVHMPKSKMKLLFWLNILVVSFLGVFSVRLLQFYFHNYTFHSSLSLDSQNLFSLTSLDFLAYFAFLLTILLWIQSLRWVWNNFRIFKVNPVNGLLVFGISTFFYIVIQILWPTENWLWSLIAIVGVLVILLFEAHSITPIVKSSMYTLLLALGTLLVIPEITARIEDRLRIDRETLANNLVLTRIDPLAVSMLELSYDQIANDPVVKNLAKAYTLGSIEETKILDYISKKYFRGYLTRFRAQLTICSAGDKLSIQPNNIQVDCKSFFKNLKDHALELVRDSSIYFMDYGQNQRGYLLSFCFKNFQPTIDLNIELWPSAFSRDMGFPELLMDDRHMSKVDLRNFSYARYEGGKLYSRAGDYSYDNLLSEDFKQDMRLRSFESNGFTHTVLKVSSDLTIIVSTSSRTVWMFITSFSFLFLLFAAIAYLVIFLGTVVHGKFRPHLSYRLRIQSAILSILVVTLLISGFFSFVFINTVFEKGSKNELISKAHSVIIELEAKFPGLTSFNDVDKEQLTNMLVRFSDIFFSDIMLYNVDGKVIASSRDQIFEEGLIAPLMDPKAYDALNVHPGSIFLHKEKIGKQEYYSVYLLYLGKNEQVIGYLNLPYFVRQHELRSELGNFLKTFINVFAVLLLIASSIGFILSSIVTRPMDIISKYLSSVKLGVPNQKIQWNRDDELGQLIDQYNNMIDQLEESAHRLKASERESAWREMALQIAHEIKNPLTPMRLSVQYLAKIWKDNPADFDLKLQRFSQTMEEQIDTLSAIASSFGDFAKLPDPRPIKIDLNDFAARTALLYGNERDSLSIEVSQHTSPVYINVDKNQLTLLVNNLMTNAIEAIPTEKRGLIRLIIEVEDSFAILKVEDNGTGISENQINNIFMPHFTTKTKGSGLGLALVKRIVQLNSGSISFESFPSVGTTFIVRFKRVEK